MLKISPPDFLYCPFCRKKLFKPPKRDKHFKYCRLCQWTYYPHVSAAVAAIIQKNSDVLLVQRNREPYIGKWMFPAGFINYGEHPDEALQREVKEETGLTTEGFKMREVIQTIDDPRSPGHFTFFYKVIVKDGIVKTDRNENQNIGWFPIKNPPKIGWQSHQRVLKQLQVELKHLKR